MTSFAAWLVLDATGAAGTALAPNTRVNKSQDLFMSSSPFPKHFPGSWTSTIMLLMREQEKNRG
jgi:hypothetical protein